MSGRGEKGARRTGRAGLELRTLAPPGWDPCSTVIRHRTSSFLAQTAQTECLKKQARVCEVKEMQIQEQSNT